MSLRFLTVSKYAKRQGRLVAHSRQTTLSRESYHTRRAHRQGEPRGERVGEVWTRRERGRGSRGSPLSTQIAMQQACLGWTCERRGSEPATGRLAAAPRGGNSEWRTEGGYAGGVAVMAAWWRWRVGGVVVGVVRPAKAARARAWSLVVLTVGVVREDRGRWQCAQRWWPSVRRGCV